MIVGTAGWSIPRQCAAEFPSDGSALERYAARFAAVEVNSSFHRPHRPGTWQRWRESVPTAFRFAVKLPRTISHERRLVDCAEPLDRFLAEAGNLQEKLAVMLVQLPPSFAFDATVAGRFFTELARRTSARIACEPRHPSWFAADADALLAALRVSRVAADPAICPEAASPGGWRGFDYRRLHGSPVVYRSSYGAERVAALAASLRVDGAVDRSGWCMFDNTASGAATIDALLLQALLHRA